jgi:hypothetical protein
MRLAFFALLFLVVAQASAQADELVSRLPDGVSDDQVLEMTRQVLSARGWNVVPLERNRLGATKGLSEMRVFIDETRLLFIDRIDRPVRDERRTGRPQRDRGPQLRAVPQAEINALRADLAAAFADKAPPIGGVLPPKDHGQVLLDVPAGADPQRVMELTRNALAGRKWVVSSDADGALVARIRNIDIDSTLKVFVESGALRFIDNTVDRKGAKALVPERWLNYIRADLRHPLSQLARESSREQDPAQRLRRLKALLDQGLLSPGEYEAKRAEILKGL